MRILIFTLFLNLLIAGPIFAANSTEIPAPNNDENIEFYTDPQSGDEIIKVKPRKNQVDSENRNYGPVLITPEIYTRPRPRPNPIPVPLGKE